MLMEMRMGQSFWHRSVRKTSQQNLPTTSAASETGDFLGHEVEVHDLPAGVDQKYAFGEMVQNVGVGEVQKLQGGTAVSAIFRFQGDDRTHDLFSSLICTCHIKGLCVGSQ